jgi:predicted CXXCH cytochrome family protein
MKRGFIALCLGFILIGGPAGPISKAAAKPGNSHKDLQCTACHATRPVQGQAVDFVTGDGKTLCVKCHEQQAGGSSLMTGTSVVSATALVKTHSSSSPIPEAMKEQMIQWLASHNYPAYGDPAVPWTLSCSSCHDTHRGSSPAMLKYNMENSGLCTFCHGGIMNIASDWSQATARRVLFGPSHLGLKQTDGTEVPAPASPEDNDVVSGVVNFPLAVLTGVHRTTADIAYRISIPGSVFNVRDVNPADHLYWDYSGDMVTWDTSLEANNSFFKVTITPYDPVTLAEGNPVVFYVLVKN